MSNRRVVAIGGGTGPLSTLNITDFGYDLTLISSVVDDGKSTGRLLALNPEILPPGDMRRMISSSSKDPLFRDSLEERATIDATGGSLTLTDLLPYYGNKEFVQKMIEVFDKTGNKNVLDKPISIDGLKGHTLGNLILAALMLEYGNTDGVKKFCEMADTSVEVIPASENPSKFCFKTKNMDRPFKGEYELDNINRHAEPIDICWLEPEIKPYQLAFERIKEAAAVILTPTSLYANLISLLLIPGYKEALKDKVIIWVGNIMTEWNQTAYSDNSLNGIGHLEVLKRYLGRYPDHAIAPRLKGEALAEVFGAYGKEGASPVLYRARDFEERGIGYTENIVDTETIVEDDVVKRVLRQNRASLAKTINELIKQYV